VEPGCLACYVRSLGRNNCGNGRNTMLGVSTRRAEGWVARPEIHRLKSMPNTAPIARRSALCANHAETQRSSEGSRSCDYDIQTRVIE